MANAFLESLREKRENKTSTVESIINRAAEEARDLTDVELANVEALNLEVKKLDERIEQMSDIELRNAKAAELAAKVDGAGVPEKRQTASVKIVSEELTYSERNAQNFLQDAVNAHFRRDPGSEERIARHQHEMAVEYRASSTASFAGLVVPAYLTSLYSPLARAGRPFADAVRKHDLPPQGMSVVISRITTGTAVAYQTTENTTSISQDPDDTTLTVDVNTIAGQNSVSKQALLRGYNIENIVLSDLIRAYHTKLDDSLLNGTGSNGQPLGLNGMTTGIVVTYTATTGTVAGVYPKIADAISQIQSTIYANPNAIVMHPRRLAFFLAGLDSSNRPLVVPNTYNPTNAMGTGLGTPPYGNSGYSLLGLPIITDANVTTTASTDQDRIYIVDLNECHLWEEAGSPTYVRFEEPNGKVALNFVLFGMSAFTALRYPGAIARIQGTGLATPSF